MKQCSKCKQLKSLTEFYANKHHKDGLKSSCKKCELQRLKIYRQSPQGREWYRQWSKQDYWKNRGKKLKQCQLWREKNKKYIKEYTKKHYQKCGKEYRKNHKNEMNRNNINYNLRNRMKVLFRYGGNPPKCACCGENHTEFLGIDHINGGGAKHKREVKGHVIPWLIKNNFPSGFQILCHNCNQAKGAYGICPHQLEIKKEEVENGLSRQSNGVFSNRI